MKAYMAFSRTAGSQEYAILVFANTAREAKKLAWKEMPFDMVDEYIDLSVRWLRNSPWIFDEAKSDKPHIIDSPKTCNGCDLWGYELNDDGYCEGCAEDLEE